MKRTVFVNALLATIVLGHVLVLAAGRELWPFSHYPMYAAVQGPVHVQTGVYGVTSAGEVPLFGAQYWRPFDHARLKRALQRMGWAGAGEERSDRALAYLLERYRARRAQGLHDGPELVGLRVYAATFRLDPVVPPTEPESRRLLFEYLP